MFHFCFHVIAVALTHLEDQENARHAYEQAAVLDRLDLLVFANY